MHHGLARAAAESVSEFRHVDQHIVYAVPAQRVSLSHHCRARSFRAQAFAPDVGIRQEEILRLSGAVPGRLIQIFALGF